MPKEVNRALGIKDTGKTNGIFSAKKTGDFTVSARYPLFWR
jgi:hypothetical protein